MMQLISICMHIFSMFYIPQEIVMMFMLSTLTNYIHMHLIIKELLVFTIVYEKFQCLPAIAQTAGDVPTNPSTKQYYVITTGRY